MVSEWWQNLHPFKTLILHVSPLFTSGINICSRWSKHKQSAETDCHLHLVVTSEMHLLWPLMIRFRKHILHLLHQCVTACRWNTKSLKSQHSLADGPVLESFNQAKVRTVFHCVTLLHIKLIVSLAWRAGGPVAAVSLSQRLGHGQAGSANKISSAAKCLNENGMVPIPQTGRGPSASTSNALPICDRNACQELEGKNRLWSFARIPVVPLNSL